MNAYVTHPSEQNLKQDISLAKKILSLLLQQKQNFIKMIYVILFALLCLSLFAIVSDQFFLYFIKPHTAGLSKIAIVASKAGPSYRKTSIDDLWLPLFTFSNHPLEIYNRDIITTESESSVEIEMNPTLKFNIEPKSIVRIQTSDGKPLIRLSKGEIKITADTDQVFLIKKGTKIEEVLIRKGSYLIKNDMSIGIQITTYNQEIKSTESLSEETKTKAQIAGLETEDSTSTATQKNFSFTKDMQFDLPTPAESNLFLVRSHSPITIGAKVFCVDACQLKIFKDQNEFKTFNFKEGDYSLVRISSSDLSVGNYSWTYSSATFEYKSNFSIQNYSEDLLGKAIENNVPVEILGND